MSRLFLTADTHFGHRRIPVYTNRRFCLTDGELKLLDAGVPTRGPDSWVPSDKSIARHDQYLIDRINEIVGPDDILWHLGDFCFTPKGRTLEFARRYCDRIICKNVNFVWGNHDEVYAYYIKELNVTIEIARIAPLFNGCYSSYALRWQGQTLILGHYAQAVWNKSHRGAYHCYGHSHSTAEPWLNIHFPERKSMDVGVDNIYKVLGEYRPISFEEIDKILAKKAGHSIDHHRPD